MLMDVLGVVVAFITIILLLSLIVTGLVQWAQSVLRIRGRNLQFGLSRMLESVDGVADRAAATELAANVLASDKLVSVGRKLLPSKMKMPAWLTGTARSYIGHDDFKELATSLGKLSAAAQAEIDELYPRLERSLTKRFAYMMKWVSFALAVAVAVVFQVSTPRLLQELSTNPELRAQYVAASEGFQSAIETSISKLDDDGAELAERAVADLVDEHAELAPLASEAAWKKGAAERRALVREAKSAALEAYDDRLAELYEERAAEVREELRSTTAELATVDIQPWRYGAAFYRDSDGFRWMNLLGVLMTAGLLTFGAPYWFNRLKEVVALRDALNPDKPK